MDQESEAKRKRSLISMSQKLEALRRIDRGVHVNQVAAEMKVGSSTIRAWRSQRGKIESWCSTNAGKIRLSNQYRMQSSMYKDVDEALFIWYNQQLLSGVRIESDVTLREQARKFHKEMQRGENFLASDSWLASWKLRHGVRQSSRCVEKLSAGSSALQEFTERMMKVIEEEQLTADQIFNCDETGLNYQKLPSKTRFARSDSEDPGYERNKDRVTVMACSNASGSLRLPLMVIGRSAKPEIDLNSDALPVFYRSHKNAWMDCKLFEEWFSTVFIPRVSRYLDERGLPLRALLIIDDDVSHPSAEQLERGGIKTMLLPSNGSSLVQPMEQGVLEAFKKRYKYRVTNSILKAQHKGHKIIQHLESIDMNEVISWLANSWREVTPMLIKKSWQKVWPTMKCGGNDQERAVPKYDEPSNVQFLLVLRQIEGCQDVDEEDLEKWIKEDDRAPEILSDQEIIGMVMGCGHDQENDGKEENILTEDCHDKVLQQWIKTEEVQQWIKMENEAEDPLSDHKMMSMIEDGQVETRRDRCNPDDEVVTPVEAMNFHTVDGCEVEEEGSTEQQIKKESEVEDPLCDQVILSMMLENSEGGSKRNRCHFEIKYLFVERKGGKLECIVCGKIMTSTNQYNLARHYTRYHEEQYKDYSADARLILLEVYEKNMAEKLIQPEAPATPLISNAAILEASYAASLTLAKSKKPFSDGNLVKKCAIEIAKAFHNEAAVREFEAVPLSHQTVARRISYMNHQVENKLHTLIRNCSYFSLCLDESMDVSGVNQLLIFLRIVQSDYSVNEELLALAPLPSPIKDDDIFNTLKMHIDEYGSFRKCSCIVTNGTKVGIKNGFVDLLNKNNINCPTFGCIIHQEALFRKSTKLLSAMKLVTDVANLVIGSSSSSTHLSHRKVQSFLKEVEVAYGDLLLPSEILWLSAGNSLVRFFDIRKDLTPFLKTIKSDTSDIVERLQCPEFLSTLAFLTDIISHLNQLNHKLQEKKQTIPYLFGHINGFRSRLTLFEMHLQNQDLSHFPCCAEIKEEFSETNFSKFKSIVTHLIADFNARFKDFQTLQSDIFLFTSPRTVKVQQQRPELQLELYNLQADPFMLTRSETDQDFYKILPDEQYPMLRDFGLKMFSMFGSTYICESTTFGTIKQLKTEKRNCMSDESVSHALRLATTEISVEIPTLVKQAYHPQKSH